MKKKKKEVWSLVCYFHSTVTKVAVVDEMELHLFVTSLF